MVIFVVAGANLVVAGAAERGEEHEPSSMCHLRNVDAYDLKPSEISCETHLQPVLWQRIVIMVVDAIFAVAGAIVAVDS